MTRGFQHKKNQIHKEKQKYNAPVKIGYYLYSVE
jgi:hypothetical protein